MDTSQSYWMLGTGPRPSPRAISSLNHWAISPGPLSFIFDKTIYSLCIRYFAMTKYLMEAIYSVLAVCGPGKPSGRGGKQLLTLYLQRGTRERTLCLLSFLPLFIQSRCLAYRMIPRTFKVKPLWAHPQRSPQRCVSQVTPNIVNLMIKMNRNT